MTPITFDKILIANRGEIAIRIARACTELNIRTYGIYAYEDRYSLHRYKIDECYQIGQEGSPVESYLDIEKIIDIAKKNKIPAIHPGYGFLSENADFAKACKRENIIFIGPKVEHLLVFGDKLEARSLAKAQNIPTIPGSFISLDSKDSAIKEARKLGFPVTLKSALGGGGKGIRTVLNEKELSDSFDLVKSEAKKNYGHAKIYIEKTILSPKHIEVQVLCDLYGNKVHLFERDCSIQRRHQKVIEIAPAISLSKKQKDQLYSYSLKLIEAVNYEGAGTIEYLVSQDGEIYFLEVNPRIQVEHTVTEMVTGIDIVQSSILIAAGFKLNHSSIGIESQSSLKCKGTAIQCRITTEDPRNNFIPDTGRVIAYRPAAGFGIRLDEGYGTSGSLITPYYDSLLVKVTAWGSNIQRVSRKMHRCLSEFRIRGVKNNIDLLKNVINHPIFLKGDFTTHFFNDNKDVFSYPTPKDRATKLLKFIGDVTINNPHDLDSKNCEVKESPRFEWPKSHEYKAKSKNAKDIFDREGTSGLVKWIKNQKKLLLTDTTMRDAHQSLFATRLRTSDILKIAPFYKNYASELFSLEVWGGATFDTCLRFLKEDPWDRLVKIRESIPNLLLQMLIRGDNAVGYKNYPSWVVREFITETAQSGLDIFRIFDCFNQTTKMSVAIDQVKKENKIVESCICYSGDITDPTKSKYDLKYYLEIAKNLEDMGTDILCIKDMAGLLKPKAASILVKALKETIDIPIHLHTHDTPGTGVSMLIAAGEAGCDIVDGALSSMSGLTSQPSLNAIIAATNNEEIQTGVDLESLDHISRFWESTRRMYKAFDPGLVSTTTDIYSHEIPGGQYSNLYQQARKVGLSSNEFYELTCRYKEVNDLLGNVIKVTPSSKIVGDTALFLHKNKITGPQLLAEKPNLDYPDSLVDYCLGKIGEPHGGIPEEIKKIVLKKVKIKPVNNTEEDFKWLNLEEAKKDVPGYTNDLNRKDILSFILYPKVYQDFFAHRKKFGNVSDLPTSIFFYGIEQGHEVECDMDQGKTLYISLQGISEANEKGIKTLFFQLNGFNRFIDIEDKNIASSKRKALKADPNNIKHIYSPMPGKVISINVKEGDSVKSGDLLLVTESMKMEYAITAKTNGSIQSILITKDEMMEGEDLLMILN